LIETPGFQEVLKNMLYNNIKSDTFAIENLIQTARSKYQDLWLNIRKDRETNAVRDLFITFKERSLKCNSIQDQFINFF